MEWLTVDSTILREFRHNKLMTMTMISKQQVLFLGGKQRRKKMRCARIELEMRCNLLGMRSGFGYLRGY